MSCDTGTFQFIGNSQKVLTWLCLFRCQEWCLSAPGAPHLADFGFSGHVTFHRAREYRMASHCGLICGKKSKLVVQLRCSHLGSSVGKEKHTVRGLCESE